MRNFPIAIIIVLAFLTVSCSGLTQHEVITWMDTKTEPPGFNVSGSWQSVNGMLNGGWGNASLTQSEAQVSGTLGLYTVEGRVAGRKLYLMILSGNRVYYTATLEPGKGNTLTGMAYAKILPDDPEARYAERAPIQLVR